MLSRFIKLIPKYQVPLTPCGAPLVESPVNPFPRLQFSTKLVRDTLLPRTGSETLGPGSDGTAASGPPLWLPSAFEPDFMKKHVLQPSPCIDQSPPPGNTTP